MTSKSFLQGFSLVYLSLPVVMALFIAIVLYFNSAGGVGPPDLQSALMLRYGLFVLIPFAAVAGFMVYKRQLSSIDPTLSLVGKLQKLQASTLIRAALLEFPGLGAGLVALRTADSSFLLFTTIMLVVLLIYRPTLSRIVEDLQLSSDEVATLQNPDSILK